MGNQSSLAAEATTSPPPAVPRADQLPGTERGRGARTVNYQSPDYPGIAITLISAPGQAGDYWTIHHYEGRTRNVETWEQAVDVADLYRAEHVHHYVPRGAAAERRLVCVCGETP